MKQFLSFLVFSTFAFGIEFYSMVYPIKTFSVKSSVSGEVVYVNKALEKSFVKNQTIIKLDSELDAVDLTQTTIKLNNLKEIKAIEDETLESYNKVSSKTKIEKDAQKIKILNMGTSIADLEVKKATLEKNLKKKNIALKNLYLSSIEVEVGDFVNAGGLLYKAYDLSKGKLEIFIPIKEAQSLRHKTIYLDGKKTNLKLNKLSLVADEKNISSYKGEIFISNPKSFSNLVKVEFK